ncbi:glycoside hydrolase family 3 protein [Streptomyces phaeolivaceus]|uniref:beta-glucosidase n=1 Tax=Streptomyces phaeolivaceus TaxID=2653200 RepID=A0A5P8KJB0_9ACTN|nr:glycoside hydrolase family 3 protein [Streptomyces phaeolivaceus]
MAGLVPPASATAHEHRQPEIGSRSAPVITVDGLRFRDLDRNGTLTPYEDWRRSPERRAKDLLGRMALPQKAGLMVHGTLPVSGQGYNLTTLTPLVADNSVTTFITRLSAPPDRVAAASNSVQELAERQPLGIPAVISTDPRNGFAVADGQTVARNGTTALPDFPGMTAADDPALTRRLGDIIRQEYRAVGITESLSPQADIATEPRWGRINGTFGSDPHQAKRQVRAYVEGMQAGSTGLRGRSVATVTKHWAGYGAQENGYDSHYYYGRYATFPGGNFNAHLTPFTGAFDAGTSGVMPTYSILKDLVHQGKKVPQVGAGFNSYLLKDLLRGRYDFDGVVLSDWAITGDCPQVCRDNRPPASFVGPWGVGMPWGVEERTIVERFALAVNAGVDQIGGSNQPAHIVEAVRRGLLSEQRVDQAAYRILLQKFQLGLFENPYVDPVAAEALVGGEAFQRVGDDAQGRSLTLLRNERRLLPVRAGKVRTVYLHGVSAQSAEARGLTVTSDPAEADLAIVRLTDPASGADLTGLDFTGTEGDFTALKAAHAAGVPTVAVPKLDRPLVLTDVMKHSDAILANYGVSDAVLLQTLFGERSPAGRLPFELPSSMAAVEAQLEDVPDDTVRPLFRRGYGLSYRCSSERTHGCRP